MVHPLKPVCVENSDIGVNEWVMTKKFCTVCSLSHSYCLYRAPVGVEVGLFPIGAEKKPKTRWGVDKLENLLDDVNSGKVCHWCIATPSRSMITRALRENQCLFM